MATPEAPVVFKFPVEFQDDTRFFRMALAEYLRAEHLPSVLFYELPPIEQSKILARAQQFKTEAKRSFASIGHEGAVE